MVFLKIQILLHAVLLLFWCIGCSDTSSKTEMDSGLNKDGTDAYGDTDTTEDDPWEWTDSPDGKDCGLGCKQITFTDHVAEQGWDIWKEYLTFQDKSGAIHVVDINNKKSARIPDVHPKYPIKEGMSAAYSPVIYENTIYYVLSIYDISPVRREIVKVDIDAETQEIVWQREEDGKLSYRVPKDLDLFGTRLVAAGGAGNPEEYTLSTFTPPWPSNGEALIDSSYGGYNSIWENIAVFWDDRKDPTNITAYDFDLGEFIPIVHNEAHQYAPRIQGKRVVYMDFSRSMSNPWESWSQAMVAMYELDTLYELWITNGEWIAATPDIYGDIVVWMDYRNCLKQKKGHLACVEIWGFDLNTETEFQITNLPDLPKSYPRIWENKVFVHMFEKDYSKDAVYMFEIQ